jgi:dTMP kinase
VVLEGGEGVGKSTQAPLLAERLGAVLTREPGGTATGEHIRALLLDPDLPPVSARAEVLLMLAARAQHVRQVVRPALEAGRDVVCDRFSGSTLAYQGYARGLPVNELQELSRWASEGLEPDLVLLLKVGRDRAASRAGARGRADRMESEDRGFFSRVEAGFDALAESDPLRWKVVDGDGSVSDVAKRIAGIVSSSLGPAAAGRGGR